ncbi:MAG: helix-turn-helix domain-containing protein [Clostridia bacterium]|nr:helix-turn-helix domain-containing protein [Clostridia bacterium]
MFVEIFNELLEENDLNRKQFAEKSGIPYTTIIGWTKLNRLPDYTALIKLADFFNCSIDYLTGRQDDYGNVYSSVEVSQAEQNLLKNFRRLDLGNKDLVIKLTKNLANLENRNKE